MGRFIKKLFDRVGNGVPTYQGGASWRLSRRWGGFAMLLIAAVSIPLTLPTPASAASPSISLSQSTNTVRINIPTGGGIGTNGHTLNVTSNSITGYNLTVSASTNDANATSLINTKDSTKLIKPVTASTTNNGNDPVTLANNTWGYNLASGTTTAVTDQNKSTAIWKPIAPLAKPATLASSTTASGTNHDGTAADNYFITYGANVAKETNNGNTTMAASGSYTATVQYTATATLPNPPTITKISPNTYQLGSANPNKVTITGTNLASAYQAWIDLDKDGQYDETEKCTIDGAITDTSLSCNVPLITTVNAGTYDIYVSTQGGQTTASNNTKYTYEYNASAKDYGTDGHVQVDYDQNMIPIYYTGNTTTAQWKTISPSTARTNPDKWYSYTESKKQWANAITVKKDALSKYQNQDDVIVSEADVLGYWVYIPRYEYQVKSMPTDVGTEGNFNIRFKYATDQSSTAPSKAGDYVLHPAFKWGSTDLNGFWVGKFETNGSTHAPTIKPNLYPIGYMRSSGDTGGYIGGYYSIAKSLGVEDKANTYGTDSFTPTYNTHHLNKSNTHMLKNSEWGAVTYLSASDNGAGVNNVQTNDNSNSGTDGNGQTSYSPAGGGNYAANVAQSTTGNQYGVYDMSGGAWEYVMGNYGTGTAVNNSNYPMTNLPRAPYVDLYNGATSTSGCTWATCGGHALYETAGWGGDSSDFVNRSSPWFERGGDYDDGSSTGLFSFNDFSGSTYGNSGFRVALRAS